MHVKSKTFLLAFVKHKVWNVRGKKFSTNLGTKKISELDNNIKKKNEQYIRWHEKNKIIDKILASEISPYVNKSHISMLKNCITLKRNSQIKYSFVVDGKVAEDMVQKILLEPKQERSFIIEANPGLGLITLNLIKSKVPKIHMYGDSTLQNISLQQLLKTYPHQLEMEHCSIFSLSCKKLVEIMDKAVKLDFNNKIIGVAQNFNFFICLINECINCSYWNCFEVTDFFLVVTKNIWKNVMQESESRQKYTTYCLFNLIFETVLLAEYPASAFLPFSLCSGDDNMFFVKISKRPNFPGKLKQQEIKSLASFCKIIGGRKSNYIIPTLEQWIPDCGPYLISKGISVTNQINDLTCDDFLKLYLILKKLKGFQNFKIVY